MVWSGLSGLVPAFISLMYVADFFTVERVGMVYIRDIPREILKKKKKGNSQETEDIEQITWVRLGTERLPF